MSVGFRATKTMWTNFSDQQIAELRESFALFDHDGDGSISESELRAAMQSLGYNPSDTQIHNMISGYDVDGNGRIDFDEYLTMMRSKMAGAPSDGEEEMRQAFRVLDADGNGYISAEELHRVMANVLRDERLTDSQISAMVRQADLDRDGRINYDDFCNFARPIFVGISKSSSLNSGRRDSRQSVCNKIKRVPSLPEVN